ncbi:MAG: recombinase family protein [Methanobacteriota archaeon]
MTRAAVYCRVSTEDHAKEGFSLEAQRRRLQDFCAARGWAVAGPYVDDGYSARSTDRPAYARMLTERDRWDVLLVIKMDRIHRNAKNFMLMMEDLASWDRQFASVQENFDTSTAMGRFVMDIIQRIAQLESEQIGERVYMGMAQKAKKGRGSLGSPHPYGYRIVEGCYVVEPREAETVRTIFRRRIEGDSLERIARALDDAGVPTKRGGPWRKQTVAGILANPLYAGRLEWDGQAAKGDHEAVIDDETFARASPEARNRADRLPSTRVSDGVPAET